jgi:hypothetical protein
VKSPALNYGVSEKPPIDWLGVGSIALPVLGCAAGVGFSIFVGNRIGLSRVGAAVGGYLVFAADTAIGLIAGVVARRRARTHRVRCGGITAAIAIVLNAAACVAALIAGTVHASWQ